MIKDAEFSGYCFCMKIKVYGDFQICISVPSTSSISKKMECIATVSANMFA